MKPPLPERMTQYENRISSRRAIFIGKVIAIVVELLVVAAIVIAATTLGFDIGGVLVKPVVLAAVVVELYRKRWRSEGAFQELTVILQCEPNTLGYPPAALFAFCLAVVAYNVLRVTRAALGAAHGQEIIEREVSSYYLAQELAKVFAGMAIALPAAEWAEYGRMSPAELARQLRQWAQQAPLWRYQKHPRGPKKPRPRRASGAKISHVATARLLANMK